MKSYWRSGGIAPRILNLDTRWRGVLSFTVRLLYPRGKIMKILCSINEKLQPVFLKPGLNYLGMLEIRKGRKSHGVSGRAKCDDFRYLNYRSSHSPPVFGNIVRTVQLFNGDLAVNFNSYCYGTSGDIFRHDCDKIFWLGYSAFIDISFCELIHRASNERICTFICSAYRQNRCVLITFLLLITGKSNNFFLNFVPYFNYQMVIIYSLLPFIIAL
jgi:hypothetical protein